MAGLNKAKGEKQAHRTRGAVAKPKRGSKAQVNYWLVKQEPDTYGWEHFVRDGGTMWDGVRNYQARNNLKAMKVGDRALFYHSGKQPEVVGIAEVTRAAYPDPTTTDDRWVVVDLKPIEKLAHPVSLASIRANAALSDLPLLKQTQLSVMPVSAKHYKEIIRMGSKGKN